MSAALKMILSFEVINFRVLHLKRHQNHLLLLLKDLINMHTNFVLSALLDALLI